MAELDSQGQRLLALLVTILPTANPRNPATFISYKEVHTRLNLQYLGATYGQSLKHQGLVSLAEWTKSERKPAITGLIVSEEGRVPGEGYFELFGKDEYAFDWWAEEIRRSKEFDWTPFLPNVELPKTPEAIDLAAPPERQKSTVYRILRDTSVTIWIKMLHQYECQICGLTIELPNGRRYAEAHHIRPLGTPHNGPDVAKNILCLCPNHHVELDYGVRPLKLNEFRTVPQHKIDEAYIRYHNENIFCRRGGTQ
jgi:hypothetical protein